LLLTDPSRSGSCFQEIPVNTVKLREFRKAKRSRFHRFICENICEKVIHPFTNKKAGKIPDMGNIKTLMPFQSGPDPRRNTKGRPKGSRNVRTVLIEILKEKVLFNDKVTRKDKIIVTQIVRKAARGNLKAAEIVMDRVDGKVPETFEVPTPPTPKSEEFVWTAEEWADHEKYFKRIYHG